MKFYQKIICTLLTLITICISCQVFLVLHKSFTLAQLLDTHAARDYQVHSQHPLTPADEIGKVKGHGAEGVRHKQTNRHMLGRNAGQQVQGDAGEGLEASLEFNNLPGDVRLRIIRQALESLLRSDDADINKLPFKLFLNCTSGKASTLIVDRHMCLGNVEVLWEVKALGVKLDAMTVLDLKVGLYKVLIGTLQDYLAINAKAKRPVLSTWWDESKLKRISDQLAGLQVRREREIREREMERVEVTEVEIMVHNEVEGEHPQANILDEREQMEIIDDYAVNGEYDDLDVKQSNQLPPNEPPHAKSAHDNDDMPLQDGTLLSGVKVPAHKNHGQPLHYDSIAARRNPHFSELKNARENPFKPPPDDYKSHAVKKRPAVPRPANHTSHGTWKKQKTPAVDKPVSKSDVSSMMDTKHRNTGQNEGASYHLTPSAFKLLGFTVQNYKSLEERGFAEEFDFATGELLKRRSFIDEAVNEMNKSQSAMELAVESLNPDLVQRGKKQEDVIEQFCGRNRIPKGLPSHSLDMETLFKHLLYDDSKRIMFCYVPKNSCSNMKRMMLILNGFLPPNASQDLYHRPSEEMLGSVKSFRDLTKQQALYRLENYYKFAIIRNPLERLLSAYKNKLETPFDVSSRKKFPDRLKAYILSLYDRGRFMKWISNKNFERDIHPTFAHFLRFMSKFSLSSYNEHFAPFLQLCFPCAVKYDVILNFKSINYDIYATMNYLKIPSMFYPPVISHRTVHTSDFLQEYFEDVPETIRSKLSQRFQKELNLYYSLHPEEAGMHI